MEKKKFSPSIIRNKWKIVPYTVSFIHEPQISISIAHKQLMQYITYLINLMQLVVQF